jgi:hypothetical protein
MIDATNNTAATMPVFSTAGAMSLLWKKAAPELKLHELEWFADGAAEQINLDTNSLAATLRGLGCMVASDEESGSFRSANDVSDLLLNLSNQVSTLNGLASIAADASYLARLALRGQS